MDRGAGSTRWGGQTHVGTSGEAEQRQLDCIKRDKQRPVGAGGEKGPSSGGRARSAP